MEESEPWFFSSGNVILEWTMQTVWSTRPRFDLNAAPEQGFQEGVREISTGAREAHDGEDAPTSDQESLPALNLTLIKLIDNFKKQINQEEFKLTDNSASSRGQAL